MLASLFLTVLTAASSAYAAEWPSIASVFAPPPVILVPDQYPGFELRFGRVTFRPAEFLTEAYLLGGLLAYLALYYYGKRTNSSRATAWIRAHTALYSSQFTTPFSSGEVVADGPSDLVAFSTGRRGLYSLFTTFTLLPRHDIFQQIYAFVRGLVDVDYQPLDEITLDFKLRTGNETTKPGFVWGVVNKNELKSLRANRFDLGVFTKTTDQVELHPTVQAMTEATDINTVLLKSGAVPSLVEALRNPQALEYFRSLIITDIPAERPDTWELTEPVASLLTRSRHVLLTFSLPPVSSAGSTLPLVKAVFDLVDALSVLNDTGSSLPGSHPAKGVTLQPETIKKLKLARKEWDDKLEKERVAEKMAEEESARLAAKKKAEDERVAKLSASEQAKHMEKERKRAMRKAQMRGAKK